VSRLIIEHGAGVLDFIQSAFRLDHGPNALKD
jgi:hypothetical protein